MWLILIFSITGVLFVVADHHWTYPPESANGVLDGTEDWGGNCQQGRRQSPVDLAEDASIIGQYSPLKFSNYGNPIQNGKVRNSGHSIQIDIPNHQKYLISGGGLPGSYRMDQMHFHWMSEHTINTRRYGLELHIVSHDIVYKNFSEALKHKNGVSVLGVFYHVSDELNRALKNILDSTEPVKDGPGQSSPLKAPLAPNDLLPKQTNSFFRYEGSLTTPTCDEAVIWTLLTESVPFEMHQIERFKEMKDEGGNQLTHNYRSLQRLNARPLVYVPDTELDYKDNSSSSIKFSITLLLALQIIYIFF